MINVFTPSVPFDTWLYGFKCYDKYLCLNEGFYHVDFSPYPVRRDIKYNRFIRRLFFAFWLSLSRPEDVCLRCSGCDSDIPCLLDYPFKGLPNEDEIVFNR